MIIIDYSGIVISNIFVQQLTNELSEDMLRHMTLNTLKMYTNKFGKEYGQVWLACDHSSWRKKYFEYYKANRSKSRDESPIDWETVFGWIAKIRDELQQFGPFRAVHSYGAEADDIIATLVHKTQEFGKSEPVMIISSDKDFLQLQQHKNVSQFSSILKKHLIEKDPKHYLFEHIVRGDSGDGVPNIFSDDDTLVTDKRQTPVTKKKLDLLYDQWKVTGAVEEKYMRNFQRNQLMIDLSQIPLDIKDQINELIDAETNRKLSSLNQFMNYLISKRCTKILKDIKDFYV